MTFRSLLNALVAGSLLSPALALAARPLQQQPGMTATHRAQQAEGEGRGRALVADVPARELARATPGSPDAAAPAVRAPRVTEELRAIAKEDAFRDAWKLGADGADVKFGLHDELGDKFTRNFASIHSDRAIGGADAPGPHQISGARFVRMVKSLPPERQVDLARYLIGKAALQLAEMEHSLGEVNSADRGILYLFELARSTLGESSQAFAKESPERFAEKLNSLGPKDAELLAHFFRNAVAEDVPNALEVASSGEALERAQTAHGQVKVSGDPARIAASAQAFREALKAHLGHAARGGLIDLPAAR